MSARRIRTVAIAVTAVLSLVVLAAAGVLRSVTDYALDSVERVTAFQHLGHRPPASEGINILLVGSDRREGISPAMQRKLHLGQAPGRRSDTMILAHISPATSSAVLVSLPRDWYVEIPAHRSDEGERVPASRNKLNAAYSLGGAGLTTATVEHNTGIRLDHYVEVNFLGFVQVVDALGGVDVCVPQRVNDPASGLVLPAGKSHLGGVRSLQYVRARKTLGSGSDLERIDRQQKFLGAMMQQALSAGTLLNPVKFSDFLNASLSAVRVDKRFSAADVRRLAMVVRDLDPERLKFVTVPIADPGASTEEAGVAAIADKVKARALFRKIRRDQFFRRRAEERDNHQPGRSEHTRPKVAIPPGRIQVEVYNGTTTDGLGAKAMDDLRRAGFLIEGPPATADPPLNATTTVVQYGPSRGDSARTLQAALPGSKLRMLPELGDDIQVVVGSSYRGTRPVTVREDSTTGESGGSNGKFNARSAAEKPCA